MVINKTIMFTTQIQTNTRVSQQVSKSIQTLQSHNLDARVSEIINKYVMINTSISRDVKFNGN